MSAQRWLLALLVPVTAGCMVLIGESFDGYGPRTDGGLEATMMVDSGTFASTPHPIDDCTPAFTVANGIAYPDHAPGAFDQTTTSDAGLITDDDPRCYQPMGLPKLPYCLILASTFHIEPNATLGVLGKRPLAIVAVKDVTIEGLLDVAGTDAFGPGAGPGAHPGSASDFGAGGAGAAEPGANACDGGAGVPGDGGLLGGGHGGGSLDTNPACHGGGLGGGALQIVSLCGQVRLIGTINASGGGGASVDDVVCGVGFGGGGGGTVWIQAPKFFLDTMQGATIGLAGGGGGGGTCREMMAGAWTTGQPANREFPGVGAQCATNTGADGGFGGLRAKPPEPGRAGTMMAPGDVGCSGGGGGRGVVVLQTDTVCNDIAGWQTGICKDMPLQ